MYSVPSPPPAWNPSPQPTALPGRTRTTTATPVPSSPTSPTRSGRLRGLSYLRSYTHNHLLSRDNHSNSDNSQRPSTLARATSYPSPTSPARISANRGPAAASPASQEFTARQISPTVQQSPTELTSARSSNLENLGSTSGWLPTVGGRSVASREASEPQPSTTASSSAVLAGTTSAAGTSDRTNTMARTRSATVAGATDIPHVDGARNEAPVQSTTNGNGMNHQLPSIRFTAHQDPRAQRPSLVFSPMARILPTGKEIIKVGRYSERDNQPPQAANVPSSAPVGFKSKVVTLENLHKVAPHKTVQYALDRLLLANLSSLHRVRIPGTIIADLEAELDDPFADGEWEQLGDEEAADVREAREATVAPEESPTTTRAGRQVNSTEDTQAVVEAPEEHSNQEQSVHSDGDAADASEGSDREGLHGISTSIEEDLDVEERPSPPSSSSSKPHVSNATVQPVDIIGRKTVSNRSSSHLALAQPIGERRITRTPSPNGLHPSSMDAVTGVEGPMTPRNDAGPFVFDGSAGRAAGLRLSNVASMNLNEAADSPIFTTPQPQATAES
ncbi:hypothetical protein D0Z07_4883 [Hyphodiscus hymeniophilus]|uniref:Uncharacterized protein n=1 Tax=Hyphodiscus hymeniophilus TaxID=353542 RepID=A0A9P6VJG7_9HELO|nr:hypothetical protein D0Z07_4883 [Hyphodiscus hymeniophilus]